jgi:FtsP/CotA-like multicopper oxidase with cupredoxin domain
MNARQSTSKLCRTPALLALVLPLVAGNAAAITYNLVAMPFNKTMPDGNSVPMWGFALDGGSCMAPPCLPSVPGPDLVVPAGDISLTVNLRNALSGPGAEPVSLVIPGQFATMSPVKFTDSQGRQRVRSFTAEATVGGSQSYTWNNLKPGTYLYHSGTHPQVQVQMGLYGAMTHDAVAGQAYSGVPYHNKVTLLFSEVDPALHGAVANGRYGQAVPDPLPPGLTAADYPSSTIDYAPKYFLVNGEPHTSASLPVAAGNTGQTILLRLLNAGLQSRSPVLQGHYMRLVAEDGNPYPHAREQYSAFLPALKTVDAVITPAEAATYPIYDRRLADGMLAFLTVADTGAGTPLATDDAYALDEDTQLVIAAPGVLDNDAAYAGDPATTASWLSGPSHGTVNLAGTGGFTYTPNPNYNGTDSFTYQAVNSSGQSLPASVSLTISPVNDAPVAADNAYSVASGETLTVAAPGVLGNDSDVDGDTLTAVNPSALAGLTLNPNGGFSYNAPATAGEVSFTYQASDGTLTSDPATVVITVTAAAPNAAPVAADNAYSVTAGETLTVAAPGVLGNDSDVDGDTLSAVLAAGPASGSLTLNGDGSFSYTPNAGFDGADSFTYQASDGTLTSAPATVTITVLANQPPVAVKDTFTVARNSTGNILNVLANDSDPDGNLDPSTVEIVVAPNKGGTATPNTTNGTVSYTPMTNFRGSENFSYRVQDSGGLWSNTVVVRVNVK